MSKQDSITSALGLRDEVWDEIEAIVKKTWENNETVSDTLIQSGLEVRDLSFGDTGHRPNLSEYEIKIMLVGFMVGVKKARNGITEAMMETHIGMMMSSSGLPPDFIKFLISMQKRGEKEED